MNYKPIVGILLGDSAGVGSEIVARLACKGDLLEYCRPVIIGDARIFERGMRIIGETVSCQQITDIDDADWTRGIPLLDLKDQDPTQIQMGVSSAYCGAAVIRMIEIAVELGKKGKLDGFCFAPLNKNAMKLAGCVHESEDYLMAHLFEVTGPFGEINVLDDVITTRTTSHIPIKDVSDHLTVQTIMRAIRLCNKTLRTMGVDNPVMGIAALNPHAGEEGLCGREEIDVIAPAMEEARKEGFRVEGPFAGDTLFTRAFKGDFDGIITMYHDQGQIALKVKGFERGVTIAGGQPLPIVTCSHGSAYDIAGKGIADTLSFENAVKLTSRMAATTAKAAR